jgi:hypothetical protein
MQMRDADHPLKLPLLEPEGDDLCPCGGRRPWNRCHGSPDVRRVPAIENSAVDSTLLALAHNVLSLLNDAIESVTVDPTDFDARLRLGDSRVSKIRQPNGNRRAFEVRKTS